jgi:hypothetical protein
MTVAGAKALARLIKENRELKERYNDLVLAVAALEPRIDQQRPDGYDCCGCSTPRQLFDDVMKIIGENSL